MDGRPAELTRTYLDGLVAKDPRALASVLDPSIDFRGLTPGRDWRGTTPDEVVEIVLGNWFEPEDHVLEVLEAQAEPMADRHHLRYRLRVENADGEFVVEQQAYFDAPDGLITRMSIVCSGYRPWEDSTPG